MHTNVILANKRRTHAQSNYTDTKLKAWLWRLLRYPDRKLGGPILQPGPTRGPIWHSVSLDPANVPAKWHVNPSNGLSSVHECDRRQTDRQTDRHTDHTTEKWAAIGEIASSVSLLRVTLKIKNKISNFC